MNKREKSTIIDIYRGILVDTYLRGLDKEDTRREFTRLLDLLGLKEERYRVENKILAKKMELTEVQEEAYEMMFNDCIKYGVYAKYGDELLDAVYNLEFEFTEEELKCNKARVELISY